MRLQPRHPLLLRFHVQLLVVRFQVLKVCTGACWDVVWGARIEDSKEKKEA